jgi:hypothetical protein
LLLDLIRSTRIEDAIKEGDSIDRVGQESRAQDEEERIELDHGRPLDLEWREN